MNIVVCGKQVPDTAAERKQSAGATTGSRAGASLVSGTVVGVGRRAVG